MLTKTLKTVLQEDLPVLFLLIGWTREYSGSELVIGAHEWLQANPSDNWEAKAFLADTRTNKVACGIGHGAVECERLHVVFVSRDPADKQRKIVGVYGAADVDMSLGYPRASTRFALLLPVESRPVLKLWPGDQGVRRWASRAGGRGTEHASLLKWFQRFRRALKVKEQARVPGRGLDDQTYSDLEAVEGVIRTRLVKHRSREVRLRDAKIAHALDQYGVEGLTCEVPGCGFNFVKQYGPLGNGFAHVHHKLPLSKTSKSGQKVRLEDLAIVCANCHAMIHRYGDSRALDEIGIKMRSR